MRIKAFTLQVDASTENGAGLHLRDAWIGVTQTAATVTEHRVVFAETFNTLADVFNGHVHGFGHFFLSLQIVWNEFVERWVKQTYVHRISVHGAEDALEVFLLVRKQLGEGFLASFNIFCENHFAHGNNLFAVEEHVFRAAKTDTNGTKLASHFCIMRSVGVCAHLQAGVLRAEVHQVSKIA